MAAKLEKTQTPGIYKRGSSYAYSYRVKGKQVWETARTLKEARDAKAARKTDVRRGEFEERSKVTLHEYVRSWVKSYEGNGKHAIREGTRLEYERQIETYVCRYFPERLRLSELTTPDVKRFGKWLREQTRSAPTTEEPNRRVPLSDETVKRIMAPLRACLRTAVEDGLIRSNPAREVKLPKRVGVESEEPGDVKAMSTEQLSTVLALLPDRWRPLFWLLGATGLRISEAIALQWRHIQLDGSEPHVKVRRALVKGHMGPPKSAHGRRDVPLDHELVRALREHRKTSEWPNDDDLVFTAGNGAAIMPNNLSRRVLKPVAQEADVAWIGFHTFRHTCATMLFGQGRNAVQVQHWLGHHSPEFTLSTYVHLLDGDMGGPLSLDAGGANGVLTGATRKGWKAESGETAKTAV